LDWPAKLGIAPCALPKVPWQFAQFDARSAADRVSASAVCCACAAPANSGKANAHAVILLVFIGFLV
jgi:hypothetical protein